MESKHLRHNEIFGCEYGDQQCRQIGLEKTWKNVLTWQKQFTGMCLFVGAACRFQQFFFNIMTDFFFKT